MSNKCMRVLISLLLFQFTVAVQAGQVAIVKGAYYSGSLRDSLVSRGINVTEIESYTAESLSGYDAVIQYGNSFVNMASLEAYVKKGGTLVETPWFWSNFQASDGLSVISYYNSNVAYSQDYPGITVNNPVSDLLAGVEFPAGSGGFNIGRTIESYFMPGVDEAASWNDGTAFIGSKVLGFGHVVAINLQVITDDTAFQVISQPWATQLMVNALSIAQVPEPTSVLLLSAGMGSLFCARRFASLRGRSILN